MKRRTFLKMSIPLAAATFALPACKRIEGSVEKPVLPLILRGGRVFYNNRWQTMDVGIDGAGKLRLARQQYEKSLAIDPRNESARAALAKLRGK